MRKLIRHTSFGKYSLWVFYVFSLIALLRIIFVFDFDFTRVFVLGGFSWMHISMMKAIIDDKKLIPAPVSFPNDASSSSRFSITAYYVTHWGILLMLVFF